MTTTPEDRDMNYVAGFLLWDGAGGNLQTLLVKKLKGVSQILGKWNAIGGKMEPGEEPYQTMTMELEEEAGCRQLFTHGDQYLTLTVDRSVVHFFRKQLSEPPVWMQREEEAMMAWRVGHVIDSWSAVPDQQLFCTGLPWQLAMAVDPNVSRAAVAEVDQ